jgi:hypothetical protein
MAHYLQRPRNGNGKRQQCGRPDSHLANGSPCRSTESMLRARLHLHDVRNAEPRRTVVHRLEQRWRRVRDAD